jgi:hypothetical protein
MPTASGAQRAMECVASQLLPRTERSGRAADVGTAKHSYCEAIVNGSTREAALDAVAEEFQATCLAIPDSALESMKGLETEVAFALDCETGAVRRIGAKLQRAYGELKPYEIAGTFDYAGKACDCAVVYDLKTGLSDIGEAADSWQLRIGALAVAAWAGLDEAEVGFVWLREGFAPKWSTARFDALDLAEFRSELHELWLRIREGSARLQAGQMPPLREGSHCTHCPARLSCPAKMALIRSAVADAGAQLRSMAEMLRAATPEELSAAYAKASPFIEAAEQLRGAFREVATERPFATRPGYVLGVHEVERSEFDGEKVYDFLAQTFSDGEARDAVEMKTSKAALGRVLKARLLAAKAEGATVPSFAGAEREMMAKLQERGAVSRVTTKRLEEHRAEIPPPLSDADAPPALAEKEVAP